LDNWLWENLAPEGFFAFRTPEVPLYFSWLLAGGPANPIVLGMNCEIDRFLLRYGGFRHYMELRGVWRVYAFLERRLGSWNREFWRSGVMRRVFKAAPYFYQNYLTGAVLRRLPVAAHEFESVTNQWGDSPHALQAKFEKDALPRSDEIRALLNSNVPVFKLTLKRHQRTWDEFGLLELLRERLDHKTS
jgi:hypothetical protein